MLPTLLAAAGDPDVKSKLLTGMKVGDKTFKVHLDGYDLSDALAGKTPSPRHEFFYFGDRGNLAALRYDQYKIVFQEQRAEGAAMWQEDYTSLAIPKLYNLRSDPFEEADHSILYWQWRVDHMFVMVPAQDVVGKFIATFKEYPPSQKVGSWSLDDVLEKMSAGAGSSK
jgi:arylsulfatase